jgi:twitching motility two-component system response regulator PilH
MNKKILVVDDSPDRAPRVERHADEAGYQVFACDNGDDAIAKAKLIRPDLILMDVVMPVSRLPATRAISRDADTKNIPIVLCTSRAAKPTRSGECARVPATIW